MPEEHTKAATAAATQAAKEATEKDATKELHARTGAEQGATAPNLPEAGPGQDLRVDENGFAQWEEEKKQWAEELADSLFVQLPFVMRKQGDRDKIIAMYTKIILEQLKLPPNRGDDTDGD